MSGQRLGEKQERVASEREAMPEDGGKAENDGWRWPKRASIVSEFAWASIVSFFLTKKVRANIHAKGVAHKRP